MLGMVEIGKHQFLIEGRLKALPFLTGFTLLDYSKNKECKVHSMIGISVPIRVTSISRMLNIVNAPYWKSLISAPKCIIIISVLNTHLFTPFDGKLL